ncbi:MAG: AAA family ATPase [Patescibacteria group bacterium]|nr:AAA family ATPase [Patescibacteria group bacterium]
MSNTTEPAAKWQPNEEQRAVLTGLLEEAAKEKSVADFAKKFLPFGRSLFDQIMDALDPARPESYFDKISEERRKTLLAELETIGEEIPVKRIQLSRIHETKILVTSKITAIETAVRECAVKSGPERIVLCPAPTGGGKTMTCNFLADKVSARLVEVRSAWRRSATGYIPLIDICKAIGVRTGKAPSFVKMQDDLVKFCNERRIVLCFDEGEFFGRESLNLLKFLLNKTTIVVVIFVVPGEYDKWFDWFPNEAGQIARRIHAIIETSVLSTKDVALFFPKDQFAEPAEALSLIAREASRFGHFSLVRRVGAALEGIVRAEDSDVRKALEKAQRQMKREGK